MKNILTLIFTVTVALPNAVGQDKVIDQFKLYAANTTRERVYLHLNQHYAQPGDRLWFNGYVFDDTNQQLSEASKVLYLNIVDSNSEVVLQEKVPLEGGMGEGYLDIPAEFDKGVYVVRAYTGWMRNFGEEHFFRDFLWVNLQPEAISFLQAGVAGDGRLTMQIVPEGHLTPVFGLTTRFTVKLTQDSIRGVASAGRVVNEAGTEVAGFSTNQFGYGAFILRPEPGMSYHVVMEGGSQRYPLPALASEGVSMLLTSQPGAVRASFQSRWGSEGKKFRILLHSKGTIFLDQELDLASQPARVLSIPLDQLRMGVYALSVVDEEGLEVGQRVFQVYPETSPIDIELESKPYSRGDKISIDFPVGQVRGYSVSVSDRQLEGTYQAPGVQEVFYMMDAFEGDGLEALGFFDPAFKKPENWDLYLLTKKHPAYNWDEILGYKVSYPRWPYEKYISAYGQVRNQDGFFLGESLFTFYSFAHQETIPARTDERGWFLLPVFDFYGTTKIVGLAENKDVSFSGMKIDVESGLPSTAIEREMFSALKAVKPSFAELRRDKLAFMGSYRKLVPGLYPEREEPEPSREFSPVTRNTEDYYLDLREYLSFASLREVFVEIGRGITVRERKGEKVIMMYDPYEERPFDEPALIFVNGIPTIDYDLVLTLDPDAIETIRLYRSATAQERFGAMGRNGILSISTKDKALEIPNQESISFYFDGFQPQEEFSNGSLSQQKKGLPDFRHQLYWRAGTTLPNYIECIASDVLSDYVINLVAVSSSGELMTGAQSFSTLPAEVARER